MDRRQFTAASAALLTAGIAGCSQSDADETPTGNGTDEPTETATGNGMDGPTETNNTQLTYEGDTLTLDNATEQEIRGNSDLEPGSDLEIVLDSGTPDDPFVKRPMTNVQSDGEFSTTVDMSDTAEGTEFTVEVIHDDETLAEADGRIA